MLDIIQTAAAWTIGIVGGIMALPYLFLGLVVILVLAAVLIFAFCFAAFMGYCAFSEWLSRRKRLKGMIKEYQARKKHLSDTITDLKQDYLNKYVVNGDDIANATDTQGKQLAQDKINSLTSQLEGMEVVLVKLHANGMAYV